MPDTPRRAPRILASLLALAALAAPAVADDPGSLEAFLKRVRTERETERARLRPRVEEIVKKLGQSRSAAEVKRLNADLEALGDEAVPLLLPYLDPGANPGAELEKQSQEVAEILARSRNPALLEELVRLASEGSPRGRVHAIRLLGESPEHARAQAALRALHPSLSGHLKAASVSALARLDPQDPLITAAFADTHPEVLAAAVRALTDEPRRAPRPEVVGLLSKPSAAADVLAELVDYFCVPGQSLDEETVSALVGFASRQDLSPEARLKVLDGLPRFGVGLSTRLRRDVEPLLSSQDAAIKDAALVALTLMKDGRARRDLMRFYDDQVKNNDSWPLAYQRRGDIEMRIGEFRDAAKDYADAIRLHGDSARLPGNRELWINLARAQVKDNKLKSAYDTLSEFGPTSDVKRTLRADPDFQPLVEHSKYKSVLE